MGFEKYHGVPKGSLVEVYENPMTGSERHVIVDEDSEGKYFRVHGAPNGDLIFSTDAELDRYTRGAEVAGFTQIL
jgi:hypothetical protein